MTDLVVVGLALLVSSSKDNFFHCKAFRSLSGCGSNVDRSATIILKLVRLATLEVLDVTKLASHGWVPRIPTERRPASPAYIISCRTTTRRPILTLRDQPRTEFRVVADENLRRPWPNRVRTTVDRPLSALPPRAGLLSSHSITLETCFFKASSRMRSSLSDTCSDPSRLIQRLGSYQLSTSQLSWSVHKTSHPKPLPVTPRLCYRSSLLGFCGCDWQNSRWRELHVNKWYKNQSSGRATVLCIPARPVRNATTESSYELVWIVSVRPHLVVQRRCDGDVVRGKFC